MLAREIESSFSSAERGTCRGLPDLRTLNASPASPMNHPLTSSGEFGRLTAIYQWIALAGLRQVKESSELFELF